MYYTIINIDTENVHKYFPQYCKSACLPSEKLLYRRMAAVRKGKRECW